METSDINFLKTILARQGRDDLATLLEGCYSAVIGSGQYGTYDHSILSTFRIYTPLDKYYKLKELNKEDKHLILSSILDLYPPAAYEPEIDSIDFRILKEDVEKKEVQQTVGRSIRIFLSYSNKDKELVGAIKVCLEQWGLEVFIAHEDIKPSVEWQQVILENLDSTDIFIPVITENFSSSEWTEQESGIAFVKNKFIIPISINGFTPRGFINKFQAHKFKVDNIDTSCLGIIEAIVSNSRFTKALIDSLINTLPNAWSFDDAGSKFKRLTGFAFSEDQVNRIIRYSVQNRQIYESWGARTILLKIVSEYKKLIKKDLLGQLSVKLRTIF